MFTKGNKRFFLKFMIQISKKKNKKFAWILCKGVINVGGNIIEYYTQKIIISCLLYLTICHCTQFFQHCNKSNYLDSPTPSTKDWEESPSCHQYQRTRKRQTVIPYSLTKPRRTTTHIAPSNLYSAARKKQRPLSYQRTNRKSTKFRMERSSRIGLLHMKNEIPSIMVKKFLFFNF